MKKTQQRLTVTLQTRNPQQEWNHSSAWMSSSSTHTQSFNRKYFLLQCATHTFTLTVILCQRNIQCENDIKQNNLELLLSIEELICTWDLVTCNMSLMYNNSTKIAQDDMIQSYSKNPIRSMLHLCRHLSQYTVGYFEIQSCLIFTENDSVFHCTDVSHFNWFLIQQNII